MLTPSPDLAALVGSRICHDLISPVGAIGNGLELMTMAGGDTGPEMALISDSVANANARIRFFRIAFGHGATGQSISETEIRAILTDIAESARWEIDWQPQGAVDRLDLRAVFLAILCCETALGRGGALTVLKEGPFWEVSAATPRLTLDEDAWTALSEARIPEDISANRVEFALLPLALEDLTRHAKVTVAPDHVVIAF